jgi:hypothetical protein
MLELAAKAAGINFHHIDDRGVWWSTSHMDERVRCWNPLTNSADALELAVKLRLNILWNGGFHHVGSDRHVFDICRLGGISEIRWEIVHAAASIGQQMGENG